MSVVVNKGEKFIKSINGCNKGKKGGDDKNIMKKGYGAGSEYYGDE